MQIKPVFTGDSMPDRIAGMGMQHHFRIANGAGSEIHQAGIVAFRLRPPKFRRCLRDDLVIVRPAFPSLRVRAPLVNEDRVTNGRARAAHLVEFGRALVIADERLSFGDLRAKLDILWREQRCAGNGNGSQLHQAKHALPPFGDAWQHHQRAVPLFDAQRGESVGGAAGAFGELREGDATLLAVWPDPEHRQFVGIGGPFADHVDGEVKLFGDVDVETASFGLIVGHMRGFRYRHSRFSLRTGYSEQHNTVVGDFFSCIISYCA